MSSRPDPAPSDVPTTRRVLFVTASARRRGAEIQATQLHAQLAARGWDVGIVALHAGTDGVALDVPVLGGRRLGLRTLWALRQRARGMDVVVAYGSATLPACATALAGTSVPFLYRSISDPAHWLRGRLHQTVTRFQYRRAARVVALWPGAAERLVEDLGVDPQRVVVIPNARDPEQFQPPTVEQRAAARQRFGLGDERVVAFVGAASPEKRLDLAIDVVARLPDHALLVAGGGAGLADAKRLAERRLDGRVQFLGEVSDVREVLYASDVVLITSDVEGMPGVAIEAALCGIPVVATAVGALPSMPAVVIARSDAADLADAVEAAIPRGDGPPNDVSTVTWPTAVSRWEALLAGTIDATA